MLNIDQISKKLSSISIEVIAGLCMFSQREGGKITPMNFVVSFFLSVQKEKHTINSWAKELSIMLQDLISYNGLKVAQTQARADFAKNLLRATLASQITKKGLNRIKSKLLEPFNRVLIEDSTCIKLPAYLHCFFPGPYSRNGEVATAKIQLRQELKSGTYTHIKLQHFRNNDQSFAANILKNLLQGDLVIRDLGYAVLPVFRKIDQLKAFFISRLRFGTNLYQYYTGEEFDLAKRLRKAVRNKENVVELYLKIGKEQQLPVRVCAIKCPANVTRQKRKKAKENRSAKANHCKEYMELLGWTIFITNVAQQTLSAQQILEVYGYRWRIEIVFKSWKSHLNLDKLFNTKTKLTKEQVHIIFYLFLVWITLFFTQMYNYYFYEIFHKKKKILSLLKFASFIKEHLLEFLINPHSDFWIDYLAYNCCYKKRNDRLNFCQQFYLLI